MILLTDTEIERFMSNIKFFAHEGCWEWAGVLSSTGYGSFRPAKSKRPYGAHRISYFMANGSFDQKMFICHKCDNPKCVNPDHLFIGTASDNMQDCVNKNRHYFAKREKCENGHDLTKNNYSLEAGRTGRIFRRCNECRKDRRKMAIKENPNKFKRSSKTQAQIEHMRKWSKDRYLKNKDKILDQISARYFKSKTHCLHGHEFIPENTIIDSRGNRKCVICKEESKMASDKRKKEYQKKYNLEKRCRRVLTKTS